MNRSLRLRAEDDEDLRIVAAVLQDALIPMSEMEFFAQDHRFALVASRFRWENCSVDADAPAPSDDENYDVAFGPCETFERVNCGICFNGVMQVRCRGMDRRDRGRILELLTIQIEHGAVILLFAGGAAVRLEGDSITCLMADIGEPWPTHWRPRHPVADTA